MPYQITNPEEINGIIYVALMQFHLAWNTVVLIEWLDSFRFSIHLYTNYNWRGEPLPYVSI